MGLIENFGRVAGTYMQEKEKLKSADEKRVREMSGHPFWPHEVLRDSIIFGAIMAVLLFYSWLIPPPLHSAADPFAQAGFVFPDWYVLFSYGYLRWGEYLPQFEIPIGPLGDFFGQPVISWNAAWWGSFLTGIPVGILALPPFLGGREKRGVEDPAFATAGVIYLGHIWFISVFSINIFLDLYGKNRSDFCKLDSHGDLVCGVREPWVAEVFNSIPWLMTGILIWIVLYLGIRWFLVNSMGAGLTPNLGKQVSVGALIIAIAFSAWTWPIYNNGFWDANGLGAMEDIEELEKMRSQPSDYHLHDANEFSQPYPSLEVPARDWMQWTIFQPTQQYLIDFANNNGHQQPEAGINAASGSSNHSGQESTHMSGAMTITDEGLETVIVDVTCEARPSERKIDGVKTLTMLDSTLAIMQDGKVIAESKGCEALELELDSGREYTYQFDLTSDSVLANNQSIYVTSSFSITAYQPLFLYDDSGTVVNLSNDTEMAAMGSYGVVENPDFHVNPKSLDAKLIYTLFIPPLTLGALCWLVLRKMARGYEYEMNKCYGCDLCDDACPVRLFNAGDKLNIIYNTWNNEDDGVPMYTCLTCSACTNACPQLVDYDSYVDIRRNLVVGGPPAAEIPHTVLQAVLAAEAEEDADADFTAVSDYPIDSNIGYYPGCVDYLDQEMIFSHVNQGEMNLGDATTAAFTLFEDMGENVSYLGRDFLKCCGHDQKWQGMTEVFEKLKAYNQKKLQASGIDTLVSSCAECFRTFARDYELEDIKVMHTTEFLTEKGFDTNLSTEEDLKVTYHDPCRLGRQMGIYDEPRDLVKAVEGVELVEMEHHGEDAMCCGVSSMMACNENSRALRVSRFDEMRATGADVVLTSCPKCVSHFECLKFEGDPRNDIEILDVVSFLAKQVENRKSVSSEESAVSTTTDKVTA
ncbi:MAG: heterodisulfide reductase-related iron-sulfur binding cluster [Candidatus Poseidoniaceae archaeon]|jgi:Fe-S oxidoreductase|nr:heterodisulfide reductase-related iron-sulfur binding cluster [Candidatus Poseidoniaceae archaeon]